MKRKYSFNCSPINDNLYSLSIVSWVENEKGERIDVEPNVQSSLTFEEVQKLIADIK